jgi:pimeloyl-ACP methyl ester carboxylesterase
MTSSPPMESIRSLPVWAIRGANDTVIPPSMATRPVEALQKIGGDIRLSILPGHDHDVWTDTYSDQAFYDWLLQHTKH